MTKANPEGGPLPSTLPQDDKELARRLQERDEVTFRLFYRQYAPGLLRRLYRLVGDPHHAEDCLQHVFAEALSSLQHYRGEGTLAAWLNRIATHVAMDFFRRQQRFKSFWERLWPEEQRDATEMTEAPDTLLEQQQERELVWEMLQKLSPRKRMAMMLCDLEGLRLEDAATQLNVPLGTVASRLYHARREFRQFAEAELRRRGETPEPRPEERER